MELNSYKLNGFFQIPFVYIIYTMYYVMFIILYMLYK